MKIIVHCTPLPVQCGKPTQHPLLRPRPPSPAKPHTGTSAPSPAMRPRHASWRRNTEEATAEAPIPAILAGISSLGAPGSPTEGTQPPGVPLPPKNRTKCSFGPFSATAIATGCPTTGVPYDVCRVQSRPRSGNDLVAGLSLVSPSCDQAIGSFHVDVSAERPGRYWCSLFAMGSLRVVDV